MRQAGRIGLDRAGVFELVVRRLADILERDPSEIRPTSRFGEDLQADSLDLVELSVVLQEELGLDINDEQLEELTTVADAVDYVLAHLGGPTT